MLLLEHSTRQASALLGGPDPTESVKALDDWLESVPQVDGDPEMSELQMVLGVGR